MADEDQDLSQLDLDQDYLSDESETFKDMMTIYKKDFKNKKSHRANKLPADITALMGEANQCFMFNRFHEAKTKAVEIIKKYPDFPDPYHLLGLIYEEQKEKKKAAMFFTLAAHLMPSDAKLWEKIGHLFKDSESYNGACYSFGRALKSDPSNKGLMLERAECYEKSGDLRKAIKVIEKFIQPDPDHTLLIIKCAKLYKKIQQPENAIDHLMKIHRRKDDSINEEIVDAICELYIWSSKYAECWNFLNGVLNINQDMKIQTIREILMKANPDIIVKYGICSAALNITEIADIAFRSLSSAADLEQDSDLFIEAAKSYQQIKDYGGAISIYENLLKLPKFADVTEGDNLKLWVNLAELYCECSKKDNAIHLYKEILTKDPENYQAKINLSKIFMEEGRRDEAVDILRVDEDKYPEKSISNEDDDNVFLSDDENGESLTHARAQKFVRNFKIAEEDRPIKKVKFEDELYKPVRMAKKAQNDNLKPLKLTKESIHKRIDDIHKRYPIEFYILKFNQAKIFLDDGKEKEFLEAIVDPLISSLNLEISIKELRKKVLNRYLFESQKKNFKKKVESGLEFESREAEQNVLLKTKKSKIPSEMLQKKKTKYSKYLTEKQFENAQILSRCWTKNKSDYYDFAGKTLTILEKHNEYSKISEICELLIKLKSEFENEKENENLMKDVLVFGFMANYYTEQYENAFYYIKSLCKTHSSDNFCHTLLALCLQKIDPTVFRMYMSKVQIRDLKKECDAIKQILGNNYLQTGFFELSVNTYMKLHEADPDNPLINLLLAVAYIQGFSSRTTVNKPQMLMRAFECLEKYKEERSKTHICEAYYNLARAYSQISMLKEAIEYYEKSIEAYMDRTLTFGTVFKEGQKSPKLDNLFHQSIYNLVIIHKHLGNTEIVKQLINDFMYIE